MRKHKPEVMTFRAQLLGWVVGLFASAIVADGAVEVVSRPYTNSAHAFGDSTVMDLSADGRWVVFGGYANGLVTNDNNGLSLDVFLRDMVNSQTILVSRSIRGASGHGDSSDASISADGRFTVFASDAGDLVEDDDNEVSDVFLYDRDSGRLSLVSRSARAAATGASGSPSITANGRFILFESEADNLVNTPVGQGLNLYRLDRETSQITLVTANASNTSGARYSVRAVAASMAAVGEDGRYVAFLSSATNLVADFPRARPYFGEPQLYLRDMASGVTRLVSRDALGQLGANLSSPQLSEDGATLIFIAPNLTAESGTGSYLHIYRTQSGQLARLVRPFSQPGALGATVDEFALSGDGRRIAFTGLGQLYLYDVGLQTNYLVSINTNGLPSNGQVTEPLISRDGEMVVFASGGTDLLPTPPGDASQVYGFDRQTGRISLLTRNVAGTNGADRDPAYLVLSADGSTAGFASFATDLVANDDRSANDAFVVATSGSNEVRLVSVPEPSQVSATAGGRSGLDAGGLSADGAWVLFTSDAADVVPSDDNRAPDVFLRHVSAGSTRLVSLSPDGVHPFPGGATSVGMSVDGATVAFTATNLLSDLNHARSLYVYRVMDGTSLIASRLPGGDVAKSVGECLLSSDGQCVAFRVTAGDVGIYLRDLRSRTTLLITNQPSATLLALSPKGRYVLVTTETRRLTVVDRDTARHITLPYELLGTNPFSDDESRFIARSRYGLVSPGLYLSSPTGDSTKLLATNVSLAGISPDGSVVVYQQQVQGEGTNVTRLFTYDVSAGTNALMPVGAASESVRLRTEPRLSVDGRFVVLVSTNSLTDNAGLAAFNKVYVYDRLLDRLSLVSAGIGGGPPNAPASRPSISIDGRIVVFESLGSDLVENDRNLAADVFLARLPAADADADGLEDGWERLQFGGRGGDPEADPDQDGASNLHEYRAGTNPSDSTSVFGLSLLAELFANHLTLVWRVVEGKTYQLQSRASLSSGGWTAVGLPTRATSPSMQVQLPLESQGIGFYRLALVE